MKKILSLFLVVALIFSLSACSGGISGKEAKGLINDFLLLLEKEDYGAAEALLHPSRPADLRAFFEGIETAENVDFSSISIEKYTGFHTAWYHSSVDGAVYGLTMKIAISGKDASMEVELVKNSDGYGIYTLDIDID